MKSFRTTALAALFISALSPLLSSSAKAEENNIWNRTKTFNFGYVMSEWKPEGCEAFKPNYGFNLSLTKTYLLHKEAIGGFLKFGIDASWFDITYDNYKASPDWLDFIDGNHDIPDYPSEGEIDTPNLGSHQIDLALGVGISANFAPFASNSGDINKLRAKIYCRFLPSFSGMIISEPDDTRFNHAFVPYISFGGQVQWKVLSVFVEGRWGSANYKIGGIDEDTDYSENTNVADAIRFDKLSCSNSGVRFGIGLNF